MSKSIQQNADDFMGATIRTLAMRRPDLRDRSGRAFWPIPAMFPLLLAHCLKALQERVTAFYLQDRWQEAEVLAACRADLLRLVYHGDLGENHTALFLADHPGLASVNLTQQFSSPFGTFCEEVLRLDDPLAVLGLLMRNEEGSIGEMQALLGEDLIAAGPFSEIHLVEEVEHAGLAHGIAKRLETVPDLWQAFQRGHRLHDQIYVTVATVQP